MVDPQAPVGQNIEKYQLLQWPGSGAYGHVYLGEDTRTHEHSAVKVLNVPLTRPEDFRVFIKEAHTFSLKHPHILPLLDFGISDDYLPFLVTEYAVGGTLRDQHPKGAKLPLPLAVRYVMQIASALLMIAIIYSTGTSSQRICFNAQMVASCSVISASPPSLIHEQRWRRERGE